MAPWPSGARQRRAPVPEAPGVAQEQRCKVTAELRPQCWHTSPTAGQALARGDTRQDHGGLRTARAAGGQRPAPHGHTARGRCGPRRPGPRQDGHVGRGSPGPRRGNTTLRRPRRASRPPPGAGRAPQCRGQGTGKTRGPRPGRVAMGTRRALTAAATALGPAVRQRPRAGGPALLPRGHGAANQEPRTARAGDWRRRPRRRARSPPPEAVGARGRACAAAPMGVGSREHVMH